MTRQGILTPTLIARESLVIAARETEGTGWNDPVRGYAEAAVRSTDLTMTLEEFSDRVIRPAVRQAIRTVYVIDPIGYERLTLLAGCYEEALERYCGITCRVLSKYDIKWDQMIMCWDFEFPGASSGWTEGMERPMPWTIAGAVVLGTAGGLAQGLQGQQSAYSASPIQSIVPTVEAQPDDTCRLELDPPAAIPVDPDATSRWSKRELDL